MPFPLVVLAPRGPLPVMAWRWDEETDILTGTLAIPDDAAGETLSVELTDEAGAVLVLDVQRGVLCGLDVVVWPEVEPRRDLVAPVGVPGLLRVAPDVAAGGGVREYTVPLRMASDFDERTFRIRWGAEPPFRAVAAADGWLVELDGDDRLAGFWLTGVGAPPALDR